MERIKYSDQEFQSVDDGFERSLSEQSVHDEQLPEDSHFYTRSHNLTGLAGTFRSSTPNRTSHFSQTYHHQSNSTATIRELERNLSEFALENEELKSEVYQLRKDFNELLRENERLNQTLQKKELIQEKMIEHAESVTKAALMLYGKLRTVKSRQYEEQFGIGTVASPGGPTTTSTTTPTTTRATGTGTTMTRAYERRSQVDRERSGASKQGGGMRFKR